MLEMKVITVISDLDNFGYKYVLRPSAEFFKFDLETLCELNYTSHRCKDFALMEYLKTLHDDELVLFTDGYDTIFLGNEEEIFIKFQQSSYDILFSAEMICWPDNALADRYPKVNTPYRYLNSGGFLGKVKALKKCLAQEIVTESTVKYPFSNQIFWTELFLKNRSTIGLDAQCRIFCSMASYEDLKTSETGKFDLKQYYQTKLTWFVRNFTVENNRIRSRLTNEYPCHFHFQGWSKLLFEEVVKGIYLEGVTTERLLCELVKLKETFLKE